ncbi:MAG: FtsB family cell division protein [Bacillota bacterium]
MSYPLSDAGHPMAVDLRTEPKPRRRRGAYRIRVRFGRLLVVVFLLYGVSVFAAQEVRVHRLRAQEAGVQAEIRQLQQANQGLQEQVNQARTDEYIEKVAREQLGLVKEGEIPYFNGTPGDPGHLEKGPGY